MRKRSIVRVFAALLGLAIVLRFGQPASQLIAQSQTSAEFILCAPEDRIADVASRHGLTIIRPIDDHIHSVVLVQGPVPPQQTNAVQGDALDTWAQQLLTEVRSDPDVEHFDINGGAVITETGSSPQLNEASIEILDSLTHTLTSFFGTSVWSGYVTQPATALIQMPQARSLADGAGVVVAIIDTGVDPHHPALAGSLVTGYDFTRNLEGDASEWPDLDEASIEILDSSSVSIVDPSAPVSVNASTLAVVDQATASQFDFTRLPQSFGHGTMVAGLVHLVAPTAKIMPLKAFKADGSSNSFDIERAIYYAVEHGAKVINMSFSSANSSAELTHAIDFASMHGVISLASVGNSGRSAVVFPAGYRNVLAIGSTSLVDERSSFSNYGDHLVKLAAPGETLITLWPGRRYAAVSGTSFSTALVSGATGLLSQLDPTLDQRKAGRYLDDGAAKRADWQLGDGRLNLYESLRLHAPISAPPPDTTPPTVTLTNPLAGAPVAGVLQLMATASDDVGVAAVQFTLDGALLGEVAAAPFAMNWDTTTTSSGAHALVATARDAAGNQSSSSVSVSVNNDATPPTVAFTSPTSGASLAGTVTLSAAASDNVGVAGVQFMLDGVNLGPEQTAAPYQIAWNSASVANGIHVLGALARDAAGNHRSASVNVMVGNDTIPPSVAITSPSDGGIVTGPITVQASAFDNVGVVGVQFALDGVNLGAEETTAPYQLPWDSGAVSNGLHVISVVARDAAGNQQTASVNLLVANAGLQE